MDNRMRELERQAVAGDVYAKQAYERTKSRVSENILDMRINWSPGFDNRPTLQLLVNKIPSREEYVYEKRGPLYFAERDGFCSFFYYVRPDRGYGGSVFNLKMKDGTIATLKGPWSSNSAAMAAAGFPPCIEVSVTDSESVLEKGHTFYGAAVTVESLIPACKRHNVRLFKTKRNYNESVWYEPGKRDGSFYVNPGYGQPGYTVNVNKHGMKPWNKNSPVIIIERLA